MFGKVIDGQAQWESLGIPGFNPRVRGTCLVSTTSYGGPPVNVFQEVLIPVCGEHVW